MKKFLSDKKNILIILFNILFSIIITLRICNDRVEIYDIKNLNIYLFLLISIFMFYISSHFLFKINKVYIETSQKMTSLYIFKINSNSQEHYEFLCDT